MLESEIRWIRLRDHLAERHASPALGGHDGYGWGPESNSSLKFWRMSLAELEQRHRRARHGRRSHQHYPPVTPALTGGGACESERLFSRLAIGSGAASEPEPVLS